MDLERVVIRDDVEPGIVAVAWYGGPAYGIGYLIDGRSFDVDLVDEEDAYEFVRHAVRYGREYAHFPRQVGLMRIYRNEYLKAGWRFRRLRLLHDGSRLERRPQHLPAVNHNLTIGDPPMCLQDFEYVDLTREGVLSLLRKWAAHPDNG